MRQHKQMAETGRVPDEDGAFGVVPLARVSGRRGAPGARGDAAADAGADVGADAGAKMLEDTARAVPCHGAPRGGRMASTPAADHGPHGGSPGPRR
ncbi:hypothetical protein [Nguyenibacter sp. L1]|uniref:hypothetical protein n=1 Tax=Nguyenibacter sp. L1 TaxID=3049350 RepID=UPI002B4A8BA3|nr:hypothetical protein [Nguyenibacter sp. L1]WRH89489.1 hypothetical protein QN315_07825 [Nguyenibacter sp. L1]